MGSVERARVRSRGHRRITSCGSSRRGSSPRGAHRRLAPARIPHARAQERAPCDESPSGGAAPYGIHVPCEARRLGPSELPRAAKPQPDLSLGGRQERQGESTDVARRGEHPRSACIVHRFLGVATAVKRFLFGTSCPRSRGSRRLGRAPGQVAGASSRSRKTPDVRVPVRVK